MKRYSLDLRERIVGAVDELELGRKEIAEIFQVSTRFITKLICQRNELGHVAPLPHGGGQMALFDEEDKERLKKAVAERPDISLEELSQAVHPGRRKDKKASITTISRVLKKLGLPRKKKDVHSRRSRSKGTRRIPGKSGITARTALHLY
jgi:transposase